MNINVKAVEIGLIAKKMNQNDLADAVGIGRSTLHYIMRGNGTSYATAGKIAEVLDIPPDKLMEATDDRP